MDGKKNAFINKSNTFMNEFNTLRIYILNIIPPLNHKVYSPPENSNLISHHKEYNYAKHLYK